MFGLTSKSATNSLIDLGQIKWCTKLLGTELHTLKHLMNIFYFIDFFLHLCCIIAICPNFLTKVLKHPCLLHKLHNQKSSKGPSCLLENLRLFAFGILSQFKASLLFLLHMINFNSTQWLDRYSLHSQWLFALEHFSVPSSWNVLVSTCLNPACPLKNKNIYPFLYPSPYGVMLILWTAIAQNCL